MPLNNPFANPAFGMASLTAAINLLPNRYGRLEELGLFNPCLSGCRTHLLPVVLAQLHQSGATVAIGVLDLIRIAGNATAPTYADLYAAKSRVTKSSRCV